MTTKTQGAKKSPFWILWLVSAFFILAFVAGTAGYFVRGGEVQIPGVPVPAGIPAVDVPTPTPTTAVETPTAVPTPTIVGVLPGVQTATNVNGTTTPAASATSVSRSGLATLPAELVGKIEVKYTYNLAVQNGILIFQPSVYVTNKSEGKITAVAVRYAVRDTQWGIIPLGGIAIDFPQKPILPGETRQITGGDGSRRELPKGVEVRPMETEVEISVSSVSFS
ncbi:MAG: hypothetical protein HYW95_02180 [Candidatus Wildermuthbacteria bacterium]|nr:hypothetical protein [Candidatus Wildermuthbacteria bacterium]